MASVVLKVSGQSPLTKRIVAVSVDVLYLSLRLSCCYELLSLVLFSL